jgi:hypothetical protein
MDELRVYHFCQRGLNSKIGPCSPPPLPPAFSYKRKLFAALKEHVVANVEQ